MKIRIITITALVGLTVSPLVSLPAYADQRITLSSSTTVLLNESAALITPNQSAYEVLASEALNFKYEILNLNSGATALAVASQHSTAACNAETGATISSRRTCSTLVASSRAVINAGSSTIESLYQSTLKITPKSGEAAVYKIKGWIDRNNNSEIDPYEPVSKALKLQTFDAKLAKSAVNFQMDPPLIQNNNISAWVSAGPSAAVVGTTSTSVMGILDPTLLTLEVVNCQQVPCQFSRVTGTWNANVLQKQYDFAGTYSFSNNAKLYFNLYYNPYSDSTLKTATKLASRSFDYSVGWPKQVKTEIVSNLISAPEAITSENFLKAGQRQNHAESGLKAFAYRATFVGADSLPLQNADVYLNVDLQEFSTWSMLRVDGIPLTTVLNDRVTLRRVTNASGQVEVQFETPTQPATNQLSIDAIVGGLRAHEISGDGREEVVVWKSNAQRLLVLKFLTDTNSKGQGVTLQATVRNGKGDIVNDERVVFSSDESLILSEAQPLVGSDGVAKTVVKVSHMAKQQGDAYVTAQVVSAGKILEERVKIKWFDYGLFTQGITADQTPLVNSATFVGKRVLEQGKTLKSSIDFATSKGTSSVQGIPVTLKFKGPGKIVQLNSTTDAQGQIHFDWVNPQNIPGAASVTASVPSSGFSKTFQVMTGVKIKVEPFRTFNEIQVNGAHGSTITAYVNGAIDTVRVATSDAFVFRTSRTENTSSKLMVAVEGVKVYLSPTQKEISVDASDTDSVAISEFPSTVKVTLMPMSGRVRASIVGAKGVQVALVSGSKSSISVATTDKAIQYLENLAKGKQLVKVYVNGEFLLSKNLTVY